MRILLISYFFPPYNTIGAVRCSKTAKYLTKFGHEVRVITAKDQLWQPTLPLEIPPNQVINTSWLNINYPVEIALGGRTQVAAKGYSPKGSLRGILKQMGWLYRTLLNFPDAYIGWFPYALSAASRLLEQWKPDAIYASALPFTAFLVADSLSRQYGIPWVAELRDLWVDNHYYKHYYNYPSWRQRIEEQLERRILSSATGLVTVSEPLASTLKAKYGKPTVVIFNGFDPGDYPSPSVIPSRDNFIKIVYTGTIYEDRRDPYVLFQALQKLETLAEKVRVAFYGRYLGGISELSKQYGVEHLVEINEMVSYEESLRLQSEADILLLLLWNDPKERGVYTGKLFEYIGARRPILAIGYPDSVAAELIRDRHAGVVLNNPVHIAEQLQQWLAQKQQTGVIPSLPEEVRIGLSREEQTKLLENFLIEILSQNLR